MVVSSSCNFLRFSINKHMFIYKMLLHSTKNITHFLASIHVLVSGIIPVLMKTELDTKGVFTCENLCRREFHSGLTSQFCIVFT